MEDSPQGIADAIKKLMSDREEATRIIQNGQKFIEDNYDVEKWRGVILEEKEQKRLEKQRKKQEKKKKKREERMSQMNETQI